MDWIIDLTGKYWLIAILASVCWGIYGLNYEKNKIEEKGDLKKLNKSGKEVKKENIFSFWWKDKIEALGILFSEFIGSFSGWYCLFLLATRWCKPVELG
ncbi:MAG: hypothetical protein KKD05_06580, partial [Candidatus Omnitrophica bacterium]|nr:hypothetical protein [Candidatus Omnitrophota bacterium]